MSGKEVKLDALGQQVEKTVISMLAEVMKPQNDDVEPGARITLLDKLRVLDRALKWQAIKLKSEDDEGGFFNFGAGDDPEDSDETARTPSGAKRGRTTKAPG